MQQYLDAFREGLHTHSTAYAIMRKYAKPCEEASNELRKAGISREDWERLTFGSDLSLEGIMYSIGGMALWFKSGAPE